MPPKIVMVIRTDWVSNVLKVTQTDDKKKKKGMQKVACLEGGIFKET